jgi:hypothetical protein
VHRFREPMSRPRNWDGRLREDVKRAGALLLRAWSFGLGLE